MPSPSKPAKRATKPCQEPFEASAVASMSRFVRELSGLCLGRVIAHLAESAEPFEASALYSVSDEKRFVDDALRLSEFRTFRDAALFGLIKAVVDGISAADPRTAFRLLENDITQIRYKTGGFFKQHADYLSLQVFCQRMPGTGTVVHGPWIIQALHFRYTVATCRATWSKSTRFSSVLLPTASTPAVAKLASHSMLTLF